MKANFCLLVLCMFYSIKAELLSPYSFFQAVFNKDYVAVYAYLSQGGLLNIKDRHDRTPMIIAARNNDVAMLELFYEFAPNCLDCENGWTPLMAAVSQNSVEVVSFLVEKDVNKNSSYNGISAFELALNYGLEEVVEILKE
ncbi:MAG: hypothetical protein UR26_C0002G0233 [candidate division TM6 bacterium GW2011_GWF2_32_72]|nr:MAG: hypothetical protein UR26_C0002G0233 [candidate division TM6 bacterium GW2011_GWF2_32_72]